MLHDWKENLGKNLDLFFLKYFHSGFVEFMEISTSLMMHLDAAMSCKT